MSSRSRWNYSFYVAVFACLLLFGNKVCAQGSTYCINEWHWIYPPGYWDEDLWYGSETPGMYPNGSPECYVYPYIGCITTFTYDCGSCNPCPNPCGPICLGLPSPTATPTPVTPSPTPTPTPTCSPVVSAQLLRGSLGNVFQNADSGDVDEALKPTTDSGILATQQQISHGFVADGVTPLLFKFEQSPPCRLTYTVTISNPTLAAHLNVLQDGVWIHGNTIAFDGLNPDQFAYIDGLAPDQVIPDGETEIDEILTLSNGGDDVVEINFSVRRPPVFLVHGYNSNSSTWSGDFLNALATATTYEPGNPDDSFIRLINYGVDNNFNTWGSFAELVPELNSALSVDENTLHNGWAFTRYDVVAHSQGGILTRLLCGQNQTDLTLKFKAPANFNRGRFRRVITIGSPHNGSTMDYYLSQMSILDNGIYGVIPTLLKTLDILQSKFDPFGDQVQAINAPSANVDPAAKFHLIADTINEDDVTQDGPRAYSWVGLTEPSFHDPLETRGQVVLGASDGVVDLDSQKAGAGTPVTQITDADICHFRLCLGPCTLFDLTSYFFGTSNSDTSDAEVASNAAMLLTEADNIFCPNSSCAFQSPVDLSSDRQVQIDIEIPFTLIEDLTQPGPFHRSAKPSGTSSYTFMFTPDPNEPLDGTANWYAEVFSPDGVTTTGLTVTPDPSDSTHVTVGVDSSVLGDVALYLSYNSTTGHLVFGKPVLVVSIPPGANLTGIEIQPNPITATVGDMIGLEIWGLYDNGSTSQLFVQPQNSTFSSSYPRIASVDSGTGLVTAARAGDATITATYAGLANAATIQVIPTLVPRPTPRPHVTPVPPPPSPRPTARPRPTPPAHLTPVPTPSSRPTPVPRP